MPNKQLLNLTLGIIIFSLSGCALPVENYTVLTTRNIDPNIPVSKSKIVRNVHGYEKKSLWVVSLFFYNPIEEAPRFEAVDQALRSADADLLINVRIYRTWWWIPYIYGQETARVEGDAVILDKK